MNQLAPAPITYPDSDGNPIAGNTKQFEWIVTIKGGLDALFKDDSNVFVAGDLLWYPVEGDPKTRQAPDAMVVFGRPRGHRGSYMQWLEGHVAPHVVFEVLSPGNRVAELARKFVFYERFGVEEYYIYDPDRGTLSGYVRQGGDRLVEVERMQGHVSPRLGVRFGMDGDDLVLEDRVGRRFRSYLEVVQARDEAVAEAIRAAAERDQVASERDQVAAERDQLAAERDQLAAERDQERRLREAAERRAAALSERLRDAGLAFNGEGSSH